MQCLAIALTQPVCRTDLQEKQAHAALSDSSFCCALAFCGPVSLVVSHTLVKRMYPTAQNKIIMCSTCGCDLQISGSGIMH
jgi:hypothetical protein